MRAELLNRMNELRDLSGSINLSTWDQETYMPSGADGSRASQLGTLQSIYHERLTDPRVAEWLASPQTANADEAAMVHLLTRERDRAVKVPSRLVKELAEAQSRGLMAWRHARNEKRFSLFEPALQRLISLRREQADAWGHGGERYDALLETYEPGMTVKRLTPVLKSLCDKLKPLIAAIENRPPPLDVFAGKKFNPEAQWQFTMKLLPALGFDLTKGRQDRSMHPFSSGLHATDVRLTTRINEETPLPAIFGTIHECGHGLYEQGFLDADSRTPLAQAPGMGIHESQSRLWENCIGRSEAFWTHFMPQLQAHFLRELGTVTPAQFSAAVCRVERTFIRVEADELTYNLHIALRYELELELIRGNIEATHAEAAWTAKTQELLGLKVESPLDGVLQDIHWSGGDFGYFPTYSLGNLYAASLFAAMQRDIGNVDAMSAKGQFTKPLQWLRKHVHAVGWRHDAEEIVKNATGQGLTEVDFLQQITARYSALYSL